MSDSIQDYHDMNVRVVKALGWTIRIQGWHDQAGTVEYKDIKQLKPDMGLYLIDEDGAVRATYLVGTAPRDPWSYFTHDIPPFSIQADYILNYVNKLIKNGGILSYIKALREVVYEDYAVNPKHPSGGWVELATPWQHCEAFIRSAPEIQKERDSFQYFGPKPSPSSTEPTSPTSPTWH